MNLVRLESALFAELGPSSRRKVGLLMLELLLPRMLRGILRLTVLPHAHVRLCGVCGVSRTDRAIIGQNTVQGEDLEHFAGAIGSIMALS